MTAKAGLTAESAMGLGERQQIGDLMITPSKENTMPSVGTDRPKAGDIFLTFTVSVENASTTDSLVFDPAMWSMASSASVQAYPVVMLKSAKDGWWPGAQAGRKDRGRSDLRGARETLRVRAGVQERYDKRGVRLSALDRGRSAKTPKGGDFTRDLRALGVFAVRDSSCFKSTRLRRSRDERHDAAA